MLMLMLSNAIANEPNANAKKDFICCEVSHMKPKPFFQVK